MIYKGYNFRVSKNIVLLKEQDGHNLLFGKLCDKNNPDAVETEYINVDDNSRVYAKPIAYKGHSLTHLMTGVDGRLYLYYNGKVYIASKNEVEKRKIK